MFTFNSQILENRKGTMEILPRVWAIKNKFYSLDFFFPSFCCLVLNIAPPPLRKKEFNIWIFLLTMHDMSFDVIVINVLLLSVIAVFVLYCDFYKYYGKLK